MSDRRLAALLRGALICPRLSAVRDAAALAARLGAAVPPLASGERPLAVYAPPGGPRVVLTTAAVHAEAVDGWAATPYAAVARVDLARGDRRAVGKEPPPDGVLLQLRAGGEVIVPVSGRGLSALPDGTTIDAVDAYTLHRFVRQAVVAAALERRAG